MFWSFSAVSCIFGKFSDLKNYTNWVDLCFALCNYLKVFNSQAFTLWSKVDCNSPSTIFQKTWWFSVGAWNVCQRTRVCCNLQSRYCWQTIRWLLQSSAWRDWSSSSSYDWRRKLYFLSYVTPMNHQIMLETKHRLCSHQDCSRETWET